MHLWQAFMPKSNRNSNGKEGITQIKTLVCNVLTVTNKNECRDLLLIKDRMTIKPEWNKTKRYTTLIQKYSQNWITLWYSNWIPSNFIIGGFLAHTTPVYFFIFISYCKFVPRRIQRHRPSTKTRTQLTIFGIFIFHIRILITYKLKIAI